MDGSEKRSVKIPNSAKSKWMNRGKCNKLIIIRWNILFEWKSGKKVFVINRVSAIFGAQSKNSSLAEEMNENRAWSAMCVSVMLRWHALGCDCVCEWTSIPKIMSFYVEYWMKEESCGHREALGEQCRPLEYSQTILSLCISSFICQNFSFIFLLLTLMAGKYPSELHTCRWPQITWSKSAVSST